MCKTIRWYQRHHNQVRLNRKMLSTFNPWKQINPYYFRHERKIIRVKIHRQTRRNNRIRLQKGWDIELEQKTNGWVSY